MQLKLKTAPALPLQTAHNIRLISGQDETPPTLQILAFQYPTVLGGATVPRNRRITPTEHQ